MPALMRGARHRVSRIPRSACRPDALGRRRSWVCATVSGEVLNGSSARVAGFSGDRGGSGRRDRPPPARSRPRGALRRGVEPGSPDLRLHQYDASLPDWSPERRLDPTLSFDYFGPRDGVGAGLTWRGNEEVGNGKLEITSSDPDSQVKMAVENDYAGTNKSYTIRLSRRRTARPRASSGATMPNTAGTCSGATPACTSTARPTRPCRRRSATCRTCRLFPNVDYKDQPISVVDVVGSRSSISARARRAPSTTSPWRPTRPRRSWSPS